MKKLLDPELKLYGDVGRRIGAKINADRTELLQIYQYAKCREDNISGNGFTSVDLVDLEIAKRFDDYSIAVTNLLREVWFLSHTETDEELAPETNKAALSRMREDATAYIESLPSMGRVLTWRNKVAAHPAAIDPRNDETPTDRDISLLPTSVGIENGRYIAPAVTPTRRSRSADDNTPTLEKWSLTRNWEQLRNRLPWLEDDSFFKEGYSIGADDGLWIKAPDNVTLDNVEFRSTVEIHPGASMEAIMGAQEDGTGGLRFKISKDDNGNISVTPTIEGKTLQPSWVRPGSAVLPDGTIVINPDSSPPEVR